MTVNISAVPKRYNCPKHGDIGDATLRFVLENVPEREYCLLCIMDVLDKVARQVTLISSEEDDHAPD